MKLIWLSDIHLEFLGAVQARSFINEVVALKSDAVLITGDISNARLLEFHLGLLAELLPCPVYFVLGNHDFYLGSFVQIDSLVKTMCSRYPNLIELGHGELIRLGTDTVLIGHRGWADGRAGQGTRSRIRLNDSQYISDFRGLDAHQIFALMNELGDDSARYISEIMPKAYTESQNIIVATHVPPFTEAALYQNKPSDPAYAPHFVNVAMGRAILECAKAHRHQSIAMLCGHTHHRAVYSPLANLRVDVAGAEYNDPKVASVLTIP